MESSYSNGYGFLLCFFITIIFDTIIIFLMVPYCINLRIKATAKFTTFLNIVRFSCYVRKRFLSSSYYNKSKYYEKKKFKSVITRNSLFNRFEICPESCLRIVCLIAETNIPEKKIAEVDIINMNIRIFDNLYFDNLKFR